MTLGAKALIAVILSGVLSLSSAVGVVAATVYRAGSIRVEVQGENGDSVHVRLPAGIANLALSMLPQPVWSEASHELRPFWPAIREIGSEFSRLPDFTLVEVRGEDHHVVVRKERQRLRVEVDADGSTIRVEIPIRTVERVASRLAGVGPTG